MSTSTAIGCIDHVVIAAGDLDRDAAIYRRLGFTLSPRGVHSAALGTANHTIMLERDYFELLTVLAPTERNTLWRETIARGGGVAGIALTTEDAAAAHAHWTAQGFAAEDPIRFSRAVTRHDGVQMEARFEVVSLAEIPTAGVRLFVCSQPTREAVWLPELTSHANTARAIASVTLACADPGATAETWRRVVPVLAVSPVAGGFRLQTSRQAIDLVDHATAAQDFGIVVPAGATQGIAMEFLVDDLDACRAVLATGGFAATSDGPVLTVPAELACNVRLGFRRR